MGWELSVSLRYLFSRKREGFISLVSLISVAGVAVGVAALIVVISVMSGFDRDLKEKIIGISSHVSIESDYGIADARAVMSRIASVPHVVATSPYLNGQVMVRRGDDVVGIVLKGIEPKDEAKTSRLSEYVGQGMVDPGPNGILVGSELASKLRLRIGSKVTVITPTFTKGHELVVRGIFTSGMYEFDANIAYVTIGKADELFGAGGLVSGIALRIDEAFFAPEVKSALADLLGETYSIRTWMDSNRNLLSALKLEKTVMFLILTLIVLVACFNISSTLIMTVLEKTRDIGILKAVGATQNGVMRLFAIQGGLIGLGGTAIGAALGLALCWALKTFNFVTLPRDIYYIDHLPVAVSPFEVGAIVAASVLISLLSTLYPAFKAGRLDPVEALRYE